MATDPIIIGPWCGAVTSSSAVIKVGLESTAPVKLLIGTEANSNGTPKSPKQVLPEETPGSEIRIVAFNLKGLKKETDFFYAVEINGSVQLDSTGRFRTFPKEDSPATFSFVCTGDADTGSNHKVFDAIGAESPSPLFLAHLGDIHYKDTNKEKVKDYQKNYARVFRSERQSRLYRKVPINYAWDDHDFCGNGSDATAIGRKAARIAYRQCVPHYPLEEDLANPSGDGNAAIYHAFTIARVRFIVLDTRSERFPDKKTMLGEAQKKWLFKELTAAKNKFKLVVIQSSVPWIGKAESGDERWWNYPKERTEIGGFIEEKGLNNVCMISADSHMLAIDDGSNNTTSTKEGIGKFPSLVASPLDRSNSKRGGTYSHGVHDENRGQYIVFTVVDTGGDSVKAIWEGKSQETGTTLISYSFNSPR